MGVSLRPLAYDEDRDSLFSEFDRGARTLRSLSPGRRLRSVVQRQSCPLLMSPLPAGTDSGTRTHPNRLRRCGSASDYGPGTTDYGLPRVRFAVASASLSSAGNRT